jgi:hypothetical protein
MQKLPSYYTSQVDEIVRIDVDGFFAGKKATESRHEGLHIG